MHNILDDTVLAFENIFKGQPAASYLKSKESGWMKKLEMIVPQQ